MSERIVETREKKHIFFFKNTQWINNGSNQIETEHQFGILHGFQPY